MDAPLDNRAIAERLETFALLLELAEANPYSVRAYRRAAELVRSTPADVAEVVRIGRVRELRGIGASIEARLVELVETGRIEELEELERTVSPEVVGYGRYLGLSARRSLDAAQALGLRTAADLARAVEDGTIRDAPGIGPKTAERLRAGLERPPGEERSLLLPQARELLEGIAAALDGTVAGDVRRCVDAPRHLAVVAPAGLAERLAGAPGIVAVVERDETHAVGVTTEGLPVELVLAEPGAAGTALLRATGAPAYVDGLAPLPEAATEEAVYAALGIPFCPPELREEPFRGEPPALVELADV
ncbi:MAG TPA: helix-hairpin-helix domain-containing protein, partial [Gaiellaceae bacterium]